MTTQSSLRLLKLPDLPRKRILDYLSISEILHLASCSQSAKSLIKSLKIHITSVSLYPLDAPEAKCYCLDVIRDGSRDSDALELHLNHGSGRSDKATDKGRQIRVTVDLGVEKVENQEKIELFYQKSPDPAVHRPKRSGNLAIINGDPPRLISDLLIFFHSTFSIDKLKISLPQRQFFRFKIYQTHRIDALTILPDNQDQDNTLSVRKLEFILTKLALKEVSIQVPIRQDGSLRSYRNFFNYHLSVAHIDISFASYMEFPRIFTNFKDCHTISIFGIRKPNNKSINKFLKSWRNMDNFRHLQSIFLKITSEFTPICHQTVLKNIPFGVSKKEDVGKELYHNTFFIERIDGKVAEVTMERRKFEMCVVDGQ